MFGCRDCNAVLADRSAYPENIYCCMLATILVCGATIQIRPRPGVGGSHTDKHTNTHTHTHTHTHTLTQKTHTHTHTHPVGLPELVIRSSQRPLRTRHTTNTTDERPCPRRDSNPLFQQSSSYIPTPGTASRLLSKNLNSGMYATITVPVALYGRKTWPVSQRVWVFEK